MVYKKYSKIEESLISDLIAHSKDYSRDEILNFIHNWSSTYNQLNNYNIARHIQFELIDEIVHNRLNLI